MPKKKNKLKFTITEPWFAKNTGGKRREAMNQIKERGFDDSITWSLFEPIGEIITPMLKRFKEMHDNYCAEPEFSEEVGKMIKAFELMATFDEWDMLGTTEDDLENRRLIEEGLESFKNNYAGLWW